MNTPDWLDVLGVHDDLFDIQMALCMLENESITGDTTATAMDITHRLITHPTNVCFTCKVLVRVKSRLEAGLQSRRFLKMPKLSGARHRRWGLTAAYVLQQPALRRACSLVEMILCSTAPDEATDERVDMTGETSEQVDVHVSTQRCFKRSRPRNSVKSVSTSVHSESSDAYLLLSSDSRPFSFSQSTESDTSSEMDCASSSSDEETEDDENEMNHAVIDRENFLYGVSDRYNELFGVIRWTTFDNVCTVLRLYDESGGYPSAVGPGSICVQKTEFGQYFTESQKSAPFESSAHVFHNYESEEYVFLQTHIPGHQNEKSTQESALNVCPTVESYELRDLGGCSVGVTETSNIIRQAYHTAMSTEDDESVMANESDFEISQILAWNGDNNLSNTATHTISKRNDAQVVEGIENVRKEINRVNGGSIGEESSVCADVFFRDVKGSSTTPHSHENDIYNGAKENSLAPDSFGEVGRERTSPPDSQNESFPLSVGTARPADSQNEPFPLSPGTVRPADSQNEPFPLSLVTVRPADSQNEPFPLSLVTVRPADSQNEPFPLSPGTVRAMPSTTASQLSFVSDDSTVSCGNNSTQSLKRLQTSQSSPKSPYENDHSSSLNVLSSKEMTYTISASTETALNAFSVSSESSFPDLLSTLSSSDSSGCSPERDCFIEKSLEACRWLGEHSADYSRTFSPLSKCFAISPEEWWVSPSKSTHCLHPRGP